MRLLTESAESPRNAVRIVAPSNIDGKSNPVTVVARGRVGFETS